MLRAVLIETIQPPDWIELRQCGDGLFKVSDLSQQVISLALISLQGPKNEKKKATCY